MYCCVCGNDMLRISTSRNELRTDNRFPDMSPPGAGLTLCFLERP